MSIPNYLEHVRAARDRYPAAWQHAHVHGDPLRWEFVKLLVNDLRVIDTNVTCNGKRGNPNDLSMDAINILCDAADSDGRTPDDRPCVVVDVIGAAGALPPYTSQNPAPSPAWNVYRTRVEGSGAPVIPTNMPPPFIPVPNAPTPAPTASKILPKGEAYAVLNALNAFYQAPEGLQRPGGLVLPDGEGRSVADMEAIAQWFYQLVIDGIPLADVFMQIRASEEWRSKHP